MAYLPIICVTIGALFGWLFTRINIFSEEKKQERKRLRRLLYNMLELKHWIDKEIGAERTITKYTEKFMATAATMLADKDPDELHELQTTLTATIKKMGLKQPMLPTLEKNIEEIIRDFSELDPFFAFELTGRYKLNETLELLKASVNDMVSETAQLPGATQIIEQLFRPKILAELQLALSEHIPRIARMIGWSSVTKAKKVLTMATNALDDPGLEAYCNDILPQLMQTIISMEQRDLTTGQDLLVE